MAAKVRRAALAGRSRLVALDVPGNFDRNVIAGRGQHKVNLGNSRRVGLNPSCARTGTKAVNLLGAWHGDAPCCSHRCFGHRYCEMKRFALMHYNAEPATANGRILDVFGMEHL